MTKDNHLLGKFNLEGIPPAKRGVPQIVVTFDIDADGILNVSAKDKSTGNTQQITITNEKGRLSPEEVEKLIKESEKFKAADEEVKKQVETKNQLEQLAYQFKNTASDEKLKDKFTEEEKKKIEDVCKETLEWLQSNQNAPLAELEERKKKLNDTCQPIIQKLYGQGGPGGPGPNMPGQGFPGGPGGPGPNMPGQQAPPQQDTNISDID